MAPTPPSYKEWEAFGNMKVIHDKDVFYIDSGQSEEVLVILHGYPTSSYDFYAVLPMLSKYFRVIVHDHIGFGLSGRPLDYSYSLVDQADIALSLWESLGIKNAHLLAHDYGTSVATELVARTNFGHCPISFQSVTIGNGSMFIQMARLLIVQRLLKSPRWGPVVARLNVKRLFDRSMRKIWYDKSKIHQEEIDVLYELLWSHPDAQETFPIVSRYIDERYRLWHRWITNGLYKYADKINLVWADKDPVAVIEMAYELQKNIPNNELLVLKDIGHYPMLESPEEYGQAVLKLLGKM